MDELIIRNGSVIDGLTPARTTRTIAVSGSRIHPLEQLDNPDTADTIDAENLVVAPGFIDVHTHDDRLVLSDPTMTPKVSQGVTTVITGNCGVSLAPLCGVEPPPPLNLLGDSNDFRYSTMLEYRDAVERFPPAINLAMQVGHSTLRAATMDDLEKPATADEIGRMGELLDAAMAAGAIGMSTGLAYAPAAHAPTEEVIALVSRLKAHNGIHTTHMRNEEGAVLESVEETIRIGKEADVPVVISHHKAGGKANWGKTRETLRRISEAQQVQSLNLDVYPYIASSTVLMAEYIERTERIIVTWSKSHPEMNGRDLAEIAGEWGMELFAAADKLQPAGAIYFQMHEDDLQRVLQFPDAMIGSDGLPHDEVPHPRLWGTFPRVLGHYCRDLGLFTLEEAVRRMTSVPAKVFGLRDRGIIREGAIADLVIFDPRTIIDSATFESSKVPAEGIHTVIVGGEIVWQNGKPTGRRPGQVLERVVM